MVMVSVFNITNRIREDKKSNKNHSTLKCKYPDRYISSSYDLSNSMKKSIIKFEEDIIAPHVSKFSISSPYYYYYSYRSMAAKMTKLAIMNSITILFMNR
jgi:hypothetical protein